MIPVFRENFLRDSEVSSIRNQLRLSFARHFEVWSSKCQEYSDNEVKVKTELFESELKLKLKLQNNRYNIIVKGY